MVALEQTAEPYHRIPLVRHHERLGLRQPFLVLQNRKITLFPVCMLPGFEDYATSRQGHTARRRVGKRHHRIRFRLHLHLHRLFPKALSRSRVEHFHRGLAFQRFPGQVEQRGRKRGTIAHPHEARQAELGHHLFGGYHLVRQQARHHVFRMGQSHEFPRRQAFGQSEAQGHHAARVCHQTGIEKGCFIQVLTNYHVLRHSVCRNTVRCFFHG